MSFGLAILSLRVLAIGQVTERPAVTALETGRLTGKVIDITGAVIPNVRVELASGTIRDQRIDVDTDGYGDFEFPNVPSGEYTMKLQARGFVSLTIKGVDIKSGEEKKLPPLELEVGACGLPLHIIDYKRFRPEQSKTGGLGGRVQLDEGPLKGNSQPVAGAEVKLLCAKVSICASTKTDNDGTFSFSNLYPGIVSLQVLKRGYYPDTQNGFRVEGGWELNYYPIYLEKCSGGDCNPAKRPKKRIAICE